MDQGLLNVIEMCKDDPELKTLADDHPLLLNALKGLELTEDEIFGILTAVENENYQLTKNFENADIRTITSFANIECQTEENWVNSCQFQMKLEDYRATIVNSIEFQIKLEEKIKEVATNFQSLYGLIENRSLSCVNEISKELSYCKEKLKKSEEECFQLKEKLDFICTERSVIEQTEANKKSANLIVKLKKSEEALQEAIKERNLWKAKAQERINLARNNSALKLKNQELEEQNTILLKEMEEYKEWENCQEKIDFKKISTRLIKIIGTRIQKRLKSYAISKLKIENKQEKSLSEQNINLMNLNEKNELQAYFLSKIYSQLCLAISNANLQRPFELDLANTKLTSANFDELLQSLSNNCFVAELNLAENSLGDENALKLSEWLKKDDFLRCLMLRNNNFSAESTGEIVDAISVQGQLNMIDLSENKINLQTLINLSTCSTSISDIIVENCNLSGEDMKSLLETLKDSQLNGLFISYNPIQKNSLRSIIQLLSKTGLKNLGLSGLQFDENHVGDLCNLIRTRPQMEILHLAHVKLTNQGLTRIMECLCQQENLRELDLTGTDALISDVCAILDSCVGLKTIVLREMKVSHKDYCLLADAIQRSPQLEVCLLDN
ncbi:RNH1 [Blepharisma stoltei]|uniref:Uncharacterized protein n=1 Tax=Blepharisma stoltei TaxID=1481888 RepID=A0AAU9JXG6_9CILI|nr:unnamed protein product [Blepharisma stoltei]